MTVKGSAMSLKIFKMKDKKLYINASVKKKKKDEKIFHYDNYFPFEILLLIYNIFKYFQYFQNIITNFSKLKFSDL